MARKTFKLPSNRTIRTRSNDRFLVVWDGPGEEPDLMLSTDNIAEARSACGKDCVVLRNLDRDVAPNNAVSESSESIDIG